MERLCSSTENIGLAMGSNGLESWFCVHTQPRREQMAASSIGQYSDIEVFLPRIRYRRATRSGPVWVTEALFPNYLFARFELMRSLRRVKHARGARDVIHFGNRWPVVPDLVIDEIKKLLSPHETYIVEPLLQPGDDVQIAGGILHGFAAVLTRVNHGTNRAHALLEFLGRQTAIELDSRHLVAPTTSRRLPSHGPVRAG
jgi:transcriptional antiterminator RfaH